MEGLQLAGHGKHKGSCDKISHLPAGLVPAASYAAPRRDGVPEGEEGAFGHICRRGRPLRQPSSAQDSAYHKTPKCHFEASYFNPIFQIPPY